MALRRVTKRSLYLFIVLVALYFLNVFFITYSESHNPTVNVSSSVPHIKCKASHSAFTSSICRIDQLASIDCVKNDRDVFIPFSFLKKHYDISGKWKDDVFEWSTSYSKIRLPPESYNSSGAFGHFATYNVEGRERVRCIDPLTEVPMSTQWNNTPYFYPIQIAQYGLEHYSRFVQDGYSLQSWFLGNNTKDWKGSAAAGGFSESSQRIFYQTEEGDEMVNITSDVAECSQLIVEGVVPDLLHVITVGDDSVLDRILEGTIPEGHVSNPGVYLTLSPNDQLTVISFSFLPLENASFSVLLSLTEHKRLVVLHYVQTKDDRCVWASEEKVADEESFTFSLPVTEGSWVSITRDLLVDASRALSLIRKDFLNKKMSNVILKSGDVRLESISFRGMQTVKRPIVQSSSAHVSSFNAAVRWFLENQNENGGWPVNVDRKMADGKLILKKGWNSAMTQGHALSLLVRASYLQPQRRQLYIGVASKALKLFNMSAAEGGIVNKFFGVSWYEEYPTTPGSFVLNGFMYSLIGLYDLFSTLSADSAGYQKELEIVRQLWEQGVQSLIDLLPLYDTGSGSLYDLRHSALKISPNVARWDYHAVHIYLLKWIVSITKEKDLDMIANRWITYAEGKRAKHN